MPRHSWCRVLKGLRLTATATNQLHTPAGECYGGRSSRTQAQLRSRSLDGKEPSRRVADAGPSGATGHTFPVLVEPPLLVQRHNQSASAHSRMAQTRSAHSMALHFPRRPGLVSMSAGDAPRPSRSDEPQASAHRHISFLESDGRASLIREDQANAGCFGSRVLADIASMEHGILIGRGDKVGVGLFNVMRF